MRLYIAEKPSMGRELAKVLGPSKKGDGFLETPAGIVTWCYGHILRQAEPEEYDERYKQWRAEDLPILPNPWRLMVSDSAAKQFHIMKALIARADEIVHAGDPDREGQLLVDEVLDYVGNTKPVRRILLNALDEKSMKDAIADLRSNGDFFPLKQSALARARADWLIGMNLSRAYTLAARRAGHRKLVLPIGRVKTPTLALVVRREREIEHFKPTDYYTIKGEFSHENGTFSAQWKMKEEQAGLDAENRLVDKKIAEEMLAAFQEDPRRGEITAYTKAQKKEPAPLPFSLSSLQVLAGKRYGFAPQLVLDTAQKLYEKKLTTYPRSDCEYLPQNQHKDAKAILTNLAQMAGAPLGEELAAWTKGADASRKSRAWNDKKISAHHAIIPTTVRVNLATLTDAEQKLYHLIARAYIAQFYPLHIFDQTKIEITYHEELFTASGRTEKSAGWKLLYTVKQEADEEEEDGGILPPMKKKDAVNYENGTLSARTTKPPTRFTAATLLAGMKEIHKYVKNPEAKKQLKDVYGIGTEATRASIIDDLIRRKFLHTEGKKKYLVPQPSAYLLVDALPDEMTYPDATAIWEDQLHAMADGTAEEATASLEAFLAAQIRFAKELCEKAWNTAITEGAEGKVHRCPRCKGMLVKRTGKSGVFWGCSNFPHCRMSCDDVNGEPAINTKNAQNRNTFSTNRTQNAPQTAWKDRAPTTFTSYGYSYPTAEEQAELDALFPPAVSASALAEQPRKSWNTAPKPSAKPLEKMRAQDSASSYTCPKCKEGHLRLVNGRNGKFWACSRYPHCTATFNDANGAPKLP